MKPKFRLYFPENLVEGKSIKLEKKQSHYIKNVIRLAEGDKISLFNSKHIFNCYSCYHFNYSCTLGTNFS